MIDLACSNLVYYLQEQIKLIDSDLFYQGSISSKIPKTKICFDNQHISTYIKNNLCKNIFINKCFEDSFLKLVEETNLEPCEYSIPDEEPSFNTFFHSFNLKEFKFDFLGIMASKIAKFNDVTLYVTECDYLYILRYQVRRLINGG